MSRHLPQDAIVRRLCLVVPEFRAGGDRSGGLDAVAQFVLDSFTVDHGWVVDVVSPRMSRRARESQRFLDFRGWRRPVAATSVVDGLPITHFGSWMAEVEFCRYLPRRGLTKAMDRADVVLVVAGTPAIAHVASRTSRPVIAQVATFLLDERVETLRRVRGIRRLLGTAMTRMVARLDEKALTGLRAVLVENQHMFDECRRRELPVHLVAPGVDCTQYRPTDKSTSGRYIIAVGRWPDPRKDLSTLLRAYALARETMGVEQRLVLAGLEGPSDADLSLIETLELGDMVEIRRRVPLDELAQLYREADLFALTSTEEGLGIVFLEAMASGVPVVATSTKGAQYALGDSGAGTLVPFGPDLVVRFAEALSHWTDPQGPNDAQAKAAARQNVLERFDATEAGARFRHLLEGFAK